MKPEELLYAKTHEWVAISDENGGQVATVGISAFAVEALTDLVYLQLPEVGLAVSPEKSSVRSKVSRRSVTCIVRSMAR